MALWKLLFGNEDEGGEEDLLADLLADFREEVRLARQLRAHAEKTPYPWMGQALKDMAVRHEHHAQLLQEKILSLGGGVPEVQGEVKEGKNNWVRLTHDLQDCKALEKAYIEQAIRWDPDVPDVVQLLQALRAEISAEVAQLRDLTLRSDPLAMD